VALYVCGAVGAIVGSILLLVVVQQGFRLCRLGYKQYTTWQDDKASLAREREALIKIFDSLGGKFWKDKTRWCSTDPVNRYVARVILYLCETKGITNVCVRARVDGKESK
jgi:hypothetical protein